MKQISLRTAAKSRRGFSLAEVMIGLTFVVMVTIAALSLMISSIQMETKYLSKTTALCACESVVACVRFADNVEELQNALEKLAEEPAPQEDGAETPVERVVNIGTEENPVLQFKQNTVMVTVAFAADAAKNFTDHNFVITVWTMSGEEIQQVQYEKN